MKSYNVLYTLFGMLAICCYSLCMEPEDPRQQIIQLISIIKTQQTILGYRPATKELCDPYYFESAFEIIAALDPKNERTKSYEQLIKKEAIPCINTIIYQYPLFEDRVHLIIERFHNNSLDFLRTTIEQNNKLLKKRELLSYYQSIMGKESVPTQEPETPTPSNIPVRHREPREILEHKDNEIQFTEATYKGLTYNYQAYVYWTNQGLECKVSDPFVIVDITAFDETGNVVFNKTNIALPLSILIDNNGRVKNEVQLPLSQNSFTVNYKNTEPLQNKLPVMAINFYKNVGTINNENDIEYLLANNVIQQEGDIYIHGQNSCKPLLEHYFKSWNVPENEYKQIQKPVIQEDQPEEQKKGWISAIKNATQRFFKKVNYFFESIYYSFLAMRTAIFGEPNISKSPEEHEHAERLRKVALEEEQHYQ